MPTELQSSTKENSLNLNTADAAGLMAIAPISPPRAVMALPMATLLAVPSLWKSDNSKAVDMLWPKTWPSATVQTAMAVRKILFIVFVNKIKSFCNYLLVEDPPERPPPLEWELPPLEWPPPLE